MFVLALLCPVNFTGAGCGWFCGGTWYVDYSASIKIQTPVATASASNKGCDSPNEQSPTSTCSISSGTTTVTDWSISGSLTVNICSQANITVGTNVGQSRTITYSANSGVTISSFCQTCKAETGLEYTSTGYELRCSCGSSALLDGTVEKFDAQYTNASSGSQPNPPCNPNCPSGG